MIGRQAAAIQRSLKKPVERLLRDFGVDCEVRRPAKLRSTPDNSLSVHWTQRDDEDTPARIVLSQMKAETRGRSWGAAVEASFAGAVALSEGILPKDIVRPRDGSFAGIAFEVVATRPTDLGSVLELALSEVPCRPEYGFVP